MTNFQLKSSKYESTMKTVLVTRRRTNIYTPCCSSDVTVLKAVMCSTEKTVQFGFIHVINQAHTIRVLNSQKKKLFDIIPVNNLCLQVHFVGNKSKKYEIEKCLVTMDTPEEYTLKVPSFLTWEEKALLILALSTKMI